MRFHNAPNMKFFAYSLAVSLLVAFLYSFQTHKHIKKCINLHSNEEQSQYEESSKKLHFHQEQTNYEESSKENHVQQNITTSHTLLIGQASSQYGNLETYLLNYSDCPSKCAYTSNLKMADVVFANVGKTAVVRRHKTQIWVGTFWESLANYPAKSFGYDFTLSYSPVATFPNFGMIRDTLSDVNQLRVPLLK